MRLNQHPLLVLLLFIALCLGIAGTAGWLTALSVHDWYPLLRKPVFNPPNWVFGPTWTVIYLMIAFAGWRLWRVCGGGCPSAWIAYALQLALNFLWSALFFGLRQPGWALADILLLWLAILSCLLLFARRDRLAAWLLAPYFAWVGFAGILNAAIVMLN